MERVATLFCGSDTYMVASAVLRALDLAKVSAGNGEIRLEHLHEALHTVGQDRTLRPASGQVSVSSNPADDDVPGC